MVDQYHCSYLLRSTIWLLNVANVGQSIICLRSISSPDYLIFPFKDNFRATYLINEASQPKIPSTDTTKGKNLALQIIASEYFALVCLQWIIQHPRFDRYCRKLLGAKESRFSGSDPDKSSAPWRSMNESLRSIPSKIIFQI